MSRKSRDSPLRLGERYGEIEYSSGKVIQRWRGSSGNVRLFYLLVSFLNLIFSQMDTFCECS